MDRIFKRVRAARRVLFVLDYDGTLTPIVERPEAALLSETTRSLLSELCRRATVAVVSGRSLDDVATRVGIDIIYAGNHGLEIRGPGFSFEAPGASATILAIQAILTEVGPLLAQLPGVFIEDKRLSASVHYRLAGDDAERNIRHVLDRAIESADAPLLLRHGKKVIELRPSIEWNKGHAACWIRDNHAPGALTICFGDDTTDEDMFIALADGVTIQVDGDRIAAQHTVDSVEQAIDMLARFNACLSDSDRDRTPR